MIRKYQQNLIHRASKFAGLLFHSTSEKLRDSVLVTHHWFNVLCLTGVDYFSSLAYQAGIALLAAGYNDPFATLFLICVTLFGAVPTYIEVSRRSYTGQGSLAILEKLVNGWRGKFLLLALISFAVTDFIITMTLSASDAAAHIIENPYFQQYVPHNNVLVTGVLLLVLGIVFYIGLSEAILISVFVTVPYLILNSINMAKCLYVIYQNPVLISNWLHQPVFRMNYTGLALLTIIAFPKLALGLSGFETGVSVMPLIHNNRAQGLTNHEILQGRLLGTKKLLITAALIMSFFLIITSFVSSILLSPKQVGDGGEAAGRALAFLAHKYLGNVFGTIYDVSTIVILSFAGASAMAGLLSIIPRYLPRFGMAPPWLESRRPLVILATGMNLLIIEKFHADVNAQAGAYATGVLALILSAAVAVTLSFAKELTNGKKISPKIIYFSLVSLVFLYTFIANIFDRPDGIIIASFFFITILLGSIISRWNRSFELRVDAADFVDESSSKIFESIQNKKVDLVPISSFDTRWFEKKVAKINAFYKINSPLAFLVIHLRDDRSEFMSPLEITVKKFSDDSPHYLIEVTGAVAIPNTIAYISDQLIPIAIYLGLARKNSMEQAISYLFFGEGEIGLLTYRVLVQYWEKSRQKEVKEGKIIFERRPMIFLMSE